MSWLVGLLSLTLGVASEAEPTVVLVGRRTAVPPALARTLARDASKHLEAAGVPLAMQPEAALSQLARVSMTDSANCNGKRACLAELGRQLKVQWVVLLSVASLNKELSVGLELLQVVDQTVVETDSLLLSRRGRLEAAQVQGFAARVKARLAPPPVEPLPAPRDAPTVAILTPPPSPEPPPPALTPVTPTPVARSHSGSIAMGITGVAGVLAGATLVVLGFVGRAPLTAGAVAADGRVRSTLTAAQARRLNEDTTPMIVGGFTAIGVGLGLGTAGVLTW